MKEHWPRWVFASVSKHFAQHFQAASVPLFVEGDDRDTALEQKFCEFRLDGPRIRELSRGYYELSVPVNILVQTTMNDENVYRHRRNMGVATSGFAKSISVFKYGTEPGIDDGSLLVCLLLQDDKLNGGLRLNDFGQVDTVTRLQQATVEGRYKGYITE